MLFNKMSEGEMIEYLQNMDTLEESLFFERKELEEQIESLEEAIRRNSFRGKADDDGASRLLSGGSRSEDRLYRILRNSYQDIENEIRDVTKELWNVDRKEQQMRNIRKCLTRLPYYQREILEDLYMRGIEWQNFAKKHSMSRATIFRARKRAMENLLALYNGSYASQDTEQLRGKRDV